MIINSASLDQLRYLDSLKLNNEEWAYESMPYSHTLYMLDQEENSKIKLGWDSYQENYYTERITNPYQTYITKSIERKVGSDRRNVYWIKIASTYPPERFYASNGVSRTECSYVEELDPDGRSFRVATLSFQGHEFKTIPDNPIQLNLSEHFEDTKYTSSIKLNIVPNDYYNGGIIYYSERAPVGFTQIGLGIDYFGLMNTNDWYHYFHRDIEGYYKPQAIIRAVQLESALHTEFNRLHSRTTGPRDPQEDPPVIVDLDPSDIRYVDGNKYLDYEINRQNDAI